MISYGPRYGWLVWQAEFLSGHEEGPGAEIFTTVEKSEHHLRTGRRPVAQYTPDGTRQLRSS